MKSLRSLRVAVAVIPLLTQLALVPSVSAQDYPDHRITFVVPYPAGGAADAIGRLLAVKLSETWKQPVVVENKSGAGGIVGNDYVAKAPGDGYTVLIGISQLVQAPNVGTKLPYDVFSDLSPVTQAVLIAPLFAVPVQRSEKTMEEFVNAVRANPGKISYGSYGIGTTSHLYGELLKKKAGIDMTHVPYRGAAPLTNDLLGGQINAAFVEVATAAPQLSGGKIRGLAIGGEKRSPLLPEIPTLAEIGFAGFEAQGWIGVFVPAATPRDIVKKLDSELSRIIKSPETAEQIKRMNLVPVGDGAEAFATVLRQDFRRWGNIARESGVRVE
ncbi:tripartite tricarboxylate transporter substrate binding protein [Bradyrhizobium sp. AUGA SZCCT0042]|uniref:Bug family tripartite tricarboxylate transporter substrate binding protein n=1 Tax=Bradyrhizobium sp. AUGA SZCCT0042 TaxID=2807651 RepID=UPI001BA5E49A|nr:tripartite tricarboxylate transporter substrate binding protein [Bradyrhizobium sp. AUGA SZCCT0042]MBR1297413.1 tripartite tricarboxylate transporter substrate binding protein [Bradyrhizobium sp. AUGA SZCCT0042]